jgi:branched-chain amino acid transport system substrate-binding protein
MITTDTPRHQEVEKGRPRHLESLITVPLPRIIFIALCLGALAVIPPGFSQEASIAPYATINHDAVNYNGPGRDARHDLAGADTRIGLLLPLSGPRQCEGEALQRAAQLAVDEANATSLPGVNRLLLVVRDESGPWGQASNQIVNLIFDDQAVALITSGEGGSAHLAEQVGNKVGVPILALSTDSTTTEINLPWIFRLGPTDAAQAQAFAADIYQRRKLQRVVLLSQNDRDGGLGGDAFIKAAAALHVPAPVQIVVDPGKIDEALAGQALSDAQAIVIWADAPTAQHLAIRARKLQSSVPIYLCRKGAQVGASAEGHLHFSAGNSLNANPWIAAAPESPQARADFYNRYRQKFGTEPGITDAEAYDAVRILAASLRQSGPNRVRLRDALAAVSAYAGASGIITFDHAGNDTSKVAVLEFK